jgi:osmoprotectant transport system permease protein
MSGNLQEQLAVLPDYLGHHLVISIIPLLLGIAISLPLAVAMVRRERLRYPVETLAGLIQTIPSLALLALMVPVLAGLSALTARAMNIEFSALGFAPTVIALTLYSTLPMIRNTVTGILEVDPDMTEAARALGMTPSQVLWKVEVPLAAPMIIAGIRTATVWVVGIATLATPVGQTCLGNYIFMGLQTRNWTSVLFGCVAAALLAIVLDALIGVVERASRTRDSRRALAAGMAMILLLAGGLAAPSLARRWQGRGPVANAGPPLKIGSKTFTEQYILAALIEHRLAAAGFETTEVTSLGSTVIFDALAHGEIDAYVDYTGTIWANHMGRDGPAGPDTVLSEVASWLEATHGIRCLGPLGFENAYALAMREDRASGLKILTIGDLARHAPEMKIGGDYEFFGRPEWRSLRAAYGLRFAAQVSFDSTFMYYAVSRGEVDVISAFSSDGRIAAFELAVLEDPQNVIPPYDAVLLLSRQAAGRPGVAEALAPLIGAIDVELMRQANQMVDREPDKTTVGEAARWLAERIGRQPVEVRR